MSFLRSCLCDRKALFCVIGLGILYGQYVCGNGLCVLLRGSSESSEIGSVIHTGLCEARTNASNDGWRVASRRGHSDRQCLLDAPSLSTKLLAAFVERYGSNIVWTVCRGCDVDGDLFCVMQVVG